MINTKYWKGNHVFINKKTGAIYAKLKQKATNTSKKTRRRWTCINWQSVLEDPNVKRSFSNFYVSAQTMKHWKKKNYVRRYRFHEIAALRLTKGNSK